MADERGAIVVAAEWKRRADRLAKTLRFYADPVSYIGGDFLAPVDRDCGKYAALVLDAEGYADPRSLSDPRKTNGPTAMPSERAIEPSLTPKG